MPRVLIETVIRHLHGLAGPGDGPSDGQLLERFVATRDEAAFAALVRRHGPMVLGVCRRVLQNAHDAEDAFQATFLVLVRKAGSLRRPELLPNWLYGVAYRTALAARSAAARRRVKERHMARPEALEETVREDLRPLLDQELSRLPDAYRAAVVLCDLEGKSRKEAAAQLGWPEGTVAGRLARARGLLAGRLARRGVTVSGAALAATLARETARAALPAPLVSSTVQAARLFAAGSAAGSASAPAALAEGVLQAMVFRTQARAATAGLLALAVFLTGVGLPAFWTLGEEPGVSRAADLPARVKGQDAKAGLQFRAYESFHGKLGLNWQPVRPDPTHVSLTKHPGTLTITTQRGTIHGDEKARGEPSAKNIFVFPNPLGKDTDWVMTTCVRDFTPTQAYQQVALICYDDDDNYLKWDYEYNWHAQHDQYFCLVREIEAKPEHFDADAVSGLEKVWLRLTKRGKSYEYATSTDGKSFKVHGEQEWGDGAPKMLGILAKNGGPEGVPEIDAQFEFFELRSPAPPREGNGGR